MSTWTTSSISTEGQLTIPQELRDRLRLRQGTKVLMQEVADGVVIMTTRLLTRPQIAEYLLDSLVTGIGPEAEKLCAIETPCHHKSYAGLQGRRVYPGSQQPPQDRQHLRRTGWLGHRARSR